MNSVPRSKVIERRARWGRDCSTWKVIRKELADSVCIDLGRWAQDVSNKAQLTLQKLTEKADEALTSLESLRRTEFKNVDRTIKLSAEVTKIQEQVARASRNADTPTLAALQHLGSKLVDIKTESVSKLNPSSSISDPEELEQAARDTLLEAYRLNIASLSRQGSGRGRYHS